MKLFGEVHLQRIALLNEILKVTDIELNALKVDDIDILENALAEKERLITKHNMLVAAEPGYVDSAEYHSKDVINILQQIEKCEKEAFKAYDEMKARCKAAAEENRKKKNAINKRFAVEKAYSQRAGITGGRVFDRKK